ncbi:MAG: GNAT family N-acetyltransferase [Gammaproteobacteria bacterium]|jgi:putative acetyltransferase
MPLEITRVDTADDSGVNALLRQSDAYHRALYPPQSIHATPLAAFLGESAAFYAGWIEGRPVACGGVILRREDIRYGEIKRLFVAAAHRGNGFAAALMHGLERFVREAGVTVMRLETGVSQPEASRLYHRLGYIVRGPFGDYGPDPLSIFMEKRLA